jgi:hypothetical protein
MWDTAGALAMFRIGDFGGGPLKSISFARLGVAAAVVSGLTTFGTSVLVASSAGASAPYTCSSGTPFNPTLIPAGSYGAVTVTGACFMQGTYNIQGGLTIAPQGVLDAAGLGPYAAPCNVFGTVSNGVQVQAGGVLYLGNGQGTGCSNTSDVVTVNGGIRATGGDTVVVHGTTINGGFSANGGGGAGDCNPTPAAPFGSYTNVEDSTVNGGLSITNLNTCWIGTIRNVVNGGETVSNNESSDTDAIEINTNLIHGGLACSGNFLNPAVPPDTTTPHAPNGVPTNFADGAGPFPNTVNGKESGQCVGL